MIPTYTKPYKDGDLRIGWASWDRDKETKKMRYKHRSIKYAYPGENGSISRGAPELPFDILLDMVVVAAEEGELDPYLEHVKSAYEKLGAILSGAEAKST